MNPKLFDLISDFLPMVGERPTLTLDTPLSALGLESLEFLDLILAVQEKFKRDIPDEMVAKLVTIGDLQKAIG